MRLVLLLLLAIASLSLSDLFSGERLGIGQKLDIVDSKLDSIIQRLKYLSEHMDSIDRYINKTIERSEARKGHRETGRRKRDTSGLLSYLEALDGK